jgi:hypothetical protein
MLTHLQRGHQRGKSTQNTSRHALAGEQQKRLDIIHAINMAQLAFQLKTSQ